jgi:hypothetical protein
MTLLVVYLALGFAFSLVFAAVGAARLDPAARGTSWLFRLLLIPGGTLLWPLLAAKWSRA